MAPSDQHRLRDVLAPALAFDEEQKRCALKIALFTACHMPIRCVDELSDLLKGELKFDLVMHRTKCTALIIGVLAPYFAEYLQKDISKQPYSLLVHESTDVSVRKLVCVSVRYYSATAKKITTTFLHLVETEDGKADTIYNAVQWALRDSELDPKHCIGLATDGANAMCGRNNSLWKKMRDDNPSITLVKCACHSLDLVASKAMEAMPASLEFMIHETHNYFAHSSSRQAVYRSLYSDSNTMHEKNEPLKILSPSATRWLAIADCIERILAQYDVLKKHFASVPDKAYSVRLLKEMYHDERNRAYLLFLEPLLTDLKRVNKLFQGEDVDPLGVFEELQKLYKRLVARILKPSVLRHHDEVSICDIDLMNLESIFLGLDDVDFGGSFTDHVSNIRLTTEEQHSLKRRCFAFLKACASDLQKRLPNATSLVRKLRAISPSSVLGANAMNALKTLPKDVFGCPEHRIEEQVRHLRQVEDVNADMPAIEFWTKIYTYRDASGANPMQDIADGAMKLLVLPISNAEAERVFSAVALTKSDLRNRMSHELLLAIIRIKFGLRLKGVTSSTFTVPRAMLAKVNSNMYT